MSDHEEIVNSDESNVNEGNEDTQDTSTQKENQSTLEISEKDLLDKLSALIDSKLEKIIAKTAVAEKPAVTKEIEKKKEIEKMISISKSFAPSQGNAESAKTFMAGTKEYEAIKDELAEQIMKKHKGGM